MKKVKINLKKIFSDKDTINFFKLVCAKIKDNFIIFDNNGKIVFSSSDFEHPLQFKKNIFFNGEKIGELHSANKNNIEFLLHLINFIVKSYFEKKELTQEALRRYRELALLYKFSEKLVTTFDKEKIAKIAIEEINKIIITDRIFIIIFQENNNPLIFSDHTSNSEYKIFFNEKIANEVIKLNESRIINDLQIEKNKVSMIYAPLKVKEDKIGIILIVSLNNFFYTSEEAKLLSSIATQTGFAFENAILHEKQLEEERLRINFGRIYIVTVIIFSAVTLMPDTSNYPGYLQMILSWGCLLVILIPLILMVRKMNMPLSTFGVTTKNLKKNILEGILFSILLIPVVILYKKITCPHKPIITWRTMRNYTPFEFWFYVITYTVHSYLQEFIARGVIQGSLAIFMKDQHYLVPIVLAASIFGIAHIHISYSAAISTFIISFIFGYIYYRHQNLIGVAILHYILGLTAIAVGLI